MATSISTLINLDKKLDTIKNLPEKNKINTKDRLQILDNQIKDLHLKYKKLTIKEISESERYFYEVKYRYLKKEINELKNELIK